MADVDDAHTRVSGPDPFPTVRGHYLKAAMVVHFGEYMAMMVTSYLVFHKTHSVVATGLILLCYNAPSLVLAGPATSLTRRFGAPLVDGWVNAAEGLLALIPMGLAITHHLGVTTLLLWVLSYGLCEGLNAPNSYLIRQLIAEPGRLHELNGSYTRNVAISAALGMIAGGAILDAWGPAWVFAICAVTAIPEVGVFFRLSQRVKTPDAEDASRESVRGSLRLLLTEPGLWAACRFAVLCFFVAGYAVTLPAIANSINARPEVLSLLESGSLLGGILVALVVRRVHGRVRWGKVQRLCYYAAGAGLALMAASEYFGGFHSKEAALVALVATIPVGFSVLLNASIVTSVIQLGTPSESRAPMFTLLALIPLVVGPISQELVGICADDLSIPMALGIVAAITIVANTVISHRPMSRHFDTLNALDVPFPVNEMLSQRSAHRGHLHITHWPKSAT